MQGVQAVDGGVFEAVGCNASDLLLKTRLMALLGLARHAATISYHDIQASFAGNPLPIDRMMHRTSPSEPRRVGSLLPRPV